MKMKLTSCVGALCLAGLITVPTLSFAASSNAENKEVQRELTSLEKEVKHLESELSADKQNHAKVRQESNLSYHGRGEVRQHHVQTNVTANDQSTEAQAPAPVAQAPVAQAPETRPLLTRTDVIKMAEQERQYLPFDLDVPGQAFVSTGPYVGVPVQYAGSYLIVNSPSVNTDLQLLKIRRSIHKQLLAMGGELFKEPYHSHLLLSGLVESQAGYFDPGGSPSRTFIDVTNVSLDAFFIGPSDWLQGFVELNYDNLPPSAANLYTVSNSRVFVNKAFVTIGDLLKSPVYGTFGQFYVPFGTYSSVMVSDTLPKLLGRTKARAIQLGLNIPGDNAPYGAIYIFRGDSHAASVSKVNNGGVNIGYKFKYGSVNGNVGGGIIADLADSGGMQVGTGFNAFEQLHHRVPAYNLRGILNLGEHINAIAEYVAAKTSFNVNDMSFNGSGARPWAFDSQLAYSFVILENKPSAIGVGYDVSHQALALGLPLERYFIVFNTSLWRNTLQSLELRHDRNYPASDTGNGPVGADTTPGACNSIVCTATGKGDNAVTAQFDYYF